MRCPFPAFRDLDRPCTWRTLTALFLYQTGLSFGPGCTVMFLLAWVLDGPQLAPSGPSLRPQSPYFFWFLHASKQRLLHLFAPRLFWPRIVGLPPSLRTCEPTFSFPFLQFLSFDKSLSSRVFEVPHTVVRSSIPNRTNWILVQFVSLSWSGNRLHSFGSPTSPLPSRRARLAASAGWRCDSLTCQSRSRRRAPRLGASRTAGAASRCLPGAGSREPDPVRSARGWTRQS